MSDKNIDWIKRMQLLEKALKENGVNNSVCVELEPKISGYELDFSEHDKVFEDKIDELEKRIQELEIIDTIRHDEKRELKQRIAELESKETSELPFDPLECANYLINATYERETSSLERGLKGLPEKVNSDRYTIDDLEQIAEHLLIYCKHNKELR